VSNTFAIVAVTAAFSQLLQRVTENPDLAGATVTNERPNEATEAGRRLNLFLFQVSPNPALRNSDLPFRGGNGDIVRQPVLALNLHYLVTAFGRSDSELDAHLVLAQGMSIVHDNSVLTRSHIRAALGAYQTFPELQKSDLPDQMEPVKLSPLTMTQEEHFKLWSTFQTPYRLSVGYEASLVMVERRKPARSAPRVRRPEVLAVPIRRPRIEELTPQILTVGETLTIEGGDLAGPGVKLRLKGGDVTPTVTPEGRLTKVVGAAGDPPLRAGIQSVQVVHEVELGSPPAPHRGFESNQAAFMLAPKLQPPIPTTVSRGQTLTLNVDPPVGRAQEAALLIGDRAIAIPPRPAPPAGTETTTSLAFPVPSTTPTGSFLMRLQIDGAESPLEVQNDAYSGPKVQIT
jgi:hypothetical protein